VKSLKAFLLLPVFYRSDGLFLGLSATFFLARALLLAKRSRFGYTARELMLLLPLVQE